MCCTWTCLHCWGLCYSCHRCLSCTWTCLYNSSPAPRCLYNRAWAAPGLVCTTSAPHLDVYTTGPELHLDMSIQQEPLLLLDVSTPQRPELQLDLSTPQRPVLNLDVSTQQVRELHIDLSGHQKPMMLLDVSHYRAWDAPGRFYLHNRCLCCIWKCQGPKLHLTFVFRILKKHFLSRYAAY